MGAAPAGSWQVPSVGVTPAGGALGGVAGRVLPYPNTAGRPSEVATGRGHPLYVPEPRTRSRPVAGEGGSVTRGAPAKRVHEALR
jgi:hypothetical protein